MLHDFLIEDQCLSGLEIVDLGKEGEVGDMVVEDQATEVEGGTGASEMQIGQEGEKATGRLR